jgi:hypothetical protein
LAISSALVFSSSSIVAISWEVQIQTCQQDDRSWVYQYPKIGDCRYIGIFLTFLF